MGKGGRKKAQALLVQASPAPRGPFPCPFLPQLQDRVYGEIGCPRTVMERRGGGASKRKLAALQSHRLSCLASALRRCTLWCSGQRQHPAGSRKQLFGTGEAGCRWETEMELPLCPWLLEAVCYTFAQAWIVLLKGACCSLPRQDSSPENSLLCAPR